MISVSNDTTLHKGICAWNGSMCSGDYCNRPHQWRSVQVCATGQPASYDDRLQIQLEFLHCARVPQESLLRMQPLGYSSGWVAPRHFLGESSCRMATFISISARCLALVSSGRCLKAASTASQQPAVLLWTGFGAAGTLFFCSALCLFGGICFCWWSVPCAQLDPAGTGLPGWLTG